VRDFAARAKRTPEQTDLLEFWNELQHSAAQRDIALYGNAPTPQPPAPLVA
jgi:hypothetical protein